MAAVILCKKCFSDIPLIIRTNWGSLKINLNKYTHFFCDICGDCLERSRSHKNLYVVKIYNETQKLFEILAAIDGLKHYLKTSDDDSKFEKQEQENILKLIEKTLYEKLV